MLVEVRNVTGRIEAAIFVDVWEAEPHPKDVRLTGFGEHGTFELVIPAEQSADVILALSAVRVQISER